jgi:cytosine/adenosine deaminase-related metal-dependent hydrolase
VLQRLEDVIHYRDTRSLEDRYLKVAISGGVQWAQSERTAHLEAAAMRRYGLLNQAHFLETSEEIEAQRERFWWYRDAGAFSPAFIFGHFVHPTDEMIVEAASAGCAMVWLPASNGRLGSGIANIRRLLGEGMRLGVGLDDQACTDIADPFQNLRVGIYLQRAFHCDPKAMGVEEMLMLHTIGSARVLGVDALVGSLEVGKFADFVVVDPACPDTGPVWDVYGSYVLACGLRNLRSVYIGGDCVCVDGTLSHPQAAEVGRQVRHRLARLVEPRVGGSNRSKVPMSDSGLI